MIPYLSTLDYVLKYGEKTEDRTGVGTRSVFGMQERYPLEPFPATTTKKLQWRSVVGELLWFLEGSTNVHRLSEITYGDPNRKNIWTENYEHQAKALGYTNGELGPIYGKQWRNFGGKDQIAEIIQIINTNPASRRIMLNAWNASEIDEMSLPPCHTLAQFSVKNKKLNCQLYQRSADLFLGVPFNIASYALLTHILAKICNIGVGEFIHTIGDAHIYENHIEQVEEQLSRIPGNLPTLSMPDFESLDEVLKLSVDDFILRDYYPQNAIPAKMAV
jgi:thymidylate synthase